MKLTVSVDDDLLARAREKAAQQRTSVQEVIRKYLAEYVGELTREDVAKVLVERLRNTGGRSGGKKFRREDVYEGRVWK